MIFFLPKEKICFLVVLSPLKNCECTILTLFYLKDTRLLTSLLLPSSLSTLIVTTFFSS
jgi:hypothetical protein